MTKHQQRPSIKATDDNISYLVGLEISAQGYDADLNHIDVSEVTNMDGLFNTHNTFNGDISRWNVGNVVSMAHMFDTSDFDGDISSWDVGNVVSMASMFSNSKFYGVLSSWNVGKVRNMFRMFANTVFNGDISRWDVSKVEEMSSMFSESIFNRDISKWNVENLQEADYMFSVSQFNQPLNAWDVKRLKTASGMFSESKFNQPLTNWKPHSLEDASFMFGYSPFAQDLSEWSMPAIKTIQGMLGSTPLVMIPSWQPHLVHLHRKNEYTDALKSMLLFGSISKNIQFKNPPSPSIKRTKNSTLAPPVPTRSPISMQHLALLFVFDHVRPKGIHPEFTPEIRSELQSWYELTNSVPLAIQQWLSIQHERNDVKNNPDEVSPASLENLFSEEP